MKNDTKCSVFIAASMDGFIAKPDGDVSWLDLPEYAISPPPGLSYEDFIETVDCIVMGRHTFEKVLTFGEWPYKNIPVMVLTGKAMELPAYLNGKAFTGSGTPEEIVASLSSEGKHHLYIDGGVTIQRFLQAGLIDELTITRIPVLLGEGISLFGHLGKEVLLKHIETSSAANGFVQNRYQVIKP